MHPMLKQDDNPARHQAAADHRPDLVAVDGEAISALQVPSSFGGLSAGLAHTPMGERPEFYLPYFVAMNVLNYQFWDVEDSRISRYARDGVVGAMAMQRGFQVQWQTLLDESAHEPDLWRRTALVAMRLRQRVQREGVGFMLGHIPSAASRIELLIEVLDVNKLIPRSQSLYARMGGGPGLTHQDAQDLARAFPKCYGDPYLKKAQLTLMFIAAEARASHGGSLKLDVCAAADYQLPKVLRAMGVLRYAPELADQVDGEVLIESGSEQERAIRSATVIACDGLTQHFGAAIESVDFWLWLQRNAARDAKFHLTRTTAY